MLNLLKLATLFGLGIMTLSIIWAVAEPLAYAVLRFIDKHTKTYADIKRDNETEILGNIHDN